MKNTRIIAVKFKISDKKSFQELLEIVDRNRWEKIRRMGIGSFSESDVPDEEEEDDEEQGELTADDVRVVLYAAPSSFATSIIEMAKSETVIAHFTDAEKMISFCIDHKLSCILIDMDPPTDCFQSTDIYVALSMLATQTSCYICTKHHNSAQVETLKKRGAKIVSKPILRKQVVSLLKGKYI